MTVDQGFDSIKVTEEYVREAINSASTQAAGIYGKDNIFATASDFVVEPDHYLLYKPNGDCEGVVVSPDDLVKGVEAATGKLGTSIPGGLTFEQFQRGLQDKEVVPPRRERWLVPSGQLVHL